MSLEALVRARLKHLDIEAIREGDVDVFVVKPHELFVLASFLKKDRDAGCDHFVDLCVVERAPRLWLVVQLVAKALRQRVQLRAVLDDDDPSFPTLTRLWPHAWTAEREAWELFGATALGHPSLRRMLVPEGFAGHPGLARYKLKKSQPQVRPPEAPARVVVNGDGDGAPEGGAP